MKDFIFYSDDLSKEIKLSEYLKGMLVELIDDPDGFSGKRPYGNSGWIWEIYARMIGEGFISGKLDVDGMVEEFDNKEADEVLKKFILEEMK